MKQIFIVLFVFLAITAPAQTKFFGTVKIEFEKTVNIHAYYKDLDAEWYEWLKEGLQKNAVTYHEFIGDSTRSIYKPGKEGVLDLRGGYRPVADKNIVFTDFKKGLSISQKPIYEETFLVEDSVSKIKWRLTPDTRTIAGYECRRAIGILDDSVAVFAFYTDEIMISGGPEGIQGLPGMILGIVVPRLHATWFATKVDVFDINMNVVTPATKGKKVNRSTMMKSLDKILRQWGTYGSKMITNFEI